jgi:DNA-binding HxlR family transcriptional regulator
VCSITDALAIVGDRYALLIAREIKYGNTRFKGIAETTGAPRDDYLLTDAGAELQPILLALKEWGDRHVNPGAEPIIFEHSCGTEFHPLTVCAACREPYREGDLTVTGGTHPVEATM